MIILEELVTRVLSEIGHLLVPFDVFGFTPKILENLMLQALNKYQEYRPILKKQVISVLSNTPITIDDAINVYSVRPYVSNGVEYTKSMDFKDWQFDKQTRQLVTSYAGDLYIEYHAEYTIETNSFISYTTTELFPEETSISVNLLSSFKKGTLLVTLNEGNIPNETITFNDVTDTLNILNTTIMYSKLTTGSLIRFSSTNTLPTGLNVNTDYYIKKRTNNDLQICTTYNNAIDIPKTFTTNYLINNTLLNIPNHGLTTNQTVQIESLGALPTGLNSSVTYYVQIFDSNNIQLKTTLLGLPVTFSNNGINTHSLITGFIDLVDTGIGIHTIEKPIYTLKEVISSYSQVTPEYINVSGNLGQGVLSFEDNTDVLISSVNYTLSKLELFIHNITAKFVDPVDINISYNSKYKSIKELSFKDVIFVNLFKGEFMKSLANAKSIRLDGLPFDITIDDLYSKGDELIQKTIEDLQNSRSKWWSFK